MNLFSRLFKYTYTYINFLNAKHINFNTIELGSSVTKLIRIYNESDLETDYQILHTNGSSVFFIKENEIKGT